MSGLGSAPEGETAGGADSGPVTAGLAATGGAAGPYAPFGERRPPAPDLVADCVHCGFCLPTCPTYVLHGNETNSPRGRLYLMKMADAGEVPMDEEFVASFDACLGCMACVSACPSGVKYDQLIAAVRPQIERNWGRSPADRAFRAILFRLFPHPNRLRLVALAAALYQQSGVQQLLARTGLMRLLPARVQALEALLPPVGLRSVAARQPAFTAALGARRARVGLVSGCVQRVFFGDVNAATTRVLAAEGCEVVAPVDQRCCGALSSHAGREDEAIRAARRLIDVFDAAAVDYVVSNVAGCGSAMKEYAELLRDDPAYAARASALAARTRDVCELLVELGPRAERQPLPARVAYHDACHLRHAQGVVTQPRAVLSRIPLLEVRDIPEAEICCGSAGIYNLVQPEEARELGRRKVEHITTTRPDIVVTANAGCLLQIRRYLTDGVPVMHPVQLVDASLRGVAP